MRWLHAISTHNRNQLVDSGPVDLYQSVKARGFRANRVLLYALQAAFLDIH
ncbi:MAG: TfoX/Sxy family DNA transformation protein [Pseudomonadales bacterium]|nr:TfoX/Sxy family DNA transformation protein [Pseudomonadales bacterium]MDP6317380.1 TfoX/Sxy family DNA transformation protein [Pseudomonadales bacterium]MDP7313336.1 TfoX/Sxy family DNA transformation protein [Pseudomonadales bacterium]MDP7576117.1 TfoX/Sxy family DNA transformation protein [Pseudomonadales bacterium]HJP52724.1 TfoX/Sxy family DNA transformation protein [Pseudomonadales bacterium]